MLSLCSNASLVIKITVCMQITMLSFCLNAIICMLIILLLVYVLRDYKLSFYIYIYHTHTVIKITFCMKMTTFIAFEQRVSIASSYLHFK